jgi:hypothetical protein
MIAQALAALGMALALASAAAAESYTPDVRRYPAGLYTTRFGDLAVRARGFERVLTWRGREIDRFETAQTARFFEDRREPRLVLIETWSGAAVCGSVWYVVDLTRSPPRVG